MNTANAVLAPSSQQYVFEKASYGVWDFKCPAKNGKETLDDYCYEKDSKDPVCLYNEWIVSINDTVLSDDTELSNYINDMTTAVCVNSSLEQGKSLQRHNPILASNFVRPDGEVNYCQDYTNPSFIGGQPVTVTDEGGRFSKNYSFKEGQQDASSSDDKFLQAYCDVFSTCCSNGARIEVSERPFASNYKKCGIEKADCSNFFKPTGGNMGELHRGLIEQLASTNGTNKMTNCYIYLAHTDDDKRYAYNDARLAWEITEYNYTNKLYEILGSKPDQVKKLTNAFVEQRFRKRDGADNLNYVCSDEQALALLDREIVSISDIKEVNDQELFNHISGQMLAGKYLIQAAKKDAAKKDNVNSTADDNKKTVVPADCKEPLAEEYKNEGITLQDKCKSACLEVSMAYNYDDTFTTDEDNKEIRDADFLGKKGDKYINNQDNKHSKCMKKCTGGEKRYSYPVYKAAKVIDRPAGIKVVSFKNIKLADYKKDRTSFEDALATYDKCLVDAGSKLSPEAKALAWTTGAGMAANLLLELYKMNVQGKISEKTFAIQLETLKASIPCYWAKADKDVLNLNPKKTYEHKTFAGRLFSLWKHTDEDMYSKQTDPALSKTYNIRNPITGLQEDMTPYDVCLVNTALAAMGAGAQQQMLCNQMLGLGLITGGTEYKYCLLGQAVPYAARNAGIFAKSAPAPTPPTPEEKKKEDKEKKKDDAAAPAAAAAAAPAAAGATTPTKETPQVPNYLNNKNPYYRPGYSRDGGLGYNYQPKDPATVSQQPSVGGVLTPPAAGNNVQVNNFGNMINGIHSAIQNNLAGGKAQ